MLLCLQKPMMRCNKGKLLRYSSLRDSFNHRIKKGFLPSNIITFYNNESYFIQMGEEVEFVRYEIN